MTKALYLVFTQPVEGQDAEFNRWFNEQHLPEVLQAKGFTKAQRFRVTPVLNTDDDLLTPYLSLYEIEGDVDETLKDLKRISPQLTKSDTLHETFFAFTALPISECLEKENGD